MINRDLKMAMSDSVEKIRNDTDEAVEGLMTSFVHDETLTNTDADRHFIMNRMLARHEILTTQLTYLKKEVDKSKIDLDHMLVLMGLRTDSAEGVEMILYDHDNLIFAKKQNKNSSSVAVKDLVTELAKAGVDKDVVAKAILAATKEKKGNVYYIVEATG